MVAQLLPHRRFFALAEVKPLPEYYEVRHQKIAIPIMTAIYVKQIIKRITQVLMFYHRAILYLYVFW